MKFSVIIPVFNGEKTIRKTIMSVLDSNLIDYEVIIVDDGSIDQTEYVCRAICNMYCNVKYFYQKNQGVSLARNYGIEMAQGEYILFVDADDTILQIDLNTIQKAIDEGVDVIIYGIVYRYFWKEKLLHEEILTTSFEGNYTANCFYKIYYQLYEDNFLSSVWNKFIRKELLKDIIFNANLNNYEDLEFVIRVLKQCKKIKIINQPLYVYENEYGVDRTTKRIAQIDDIMANTDIIIEAILDLDYALYVNFGKHIDHLYEFISRIYLEIFRQKMYTTRFCEMGRYCEDFLTNKNIQMCENSDIFLATNSEYINIKNKNVCRIYFRSRYIMIRHFLANKIKLVRMLLQR